jgi:hypothetical protein
VQVNCGSCTSPNTCGGGGTANVCGCTPNLNSCGVWICGVAPDGCGGYNDCGTCDPGSYCAGHICKCTAQCF